MNIEYKIEYVKGIIMLHIFIVTTTTNVRKLFLHSKIFYLVLTQTFR